MVKVQNLIWYYLILCTNILLDGVAFTLTHESFNYMHKYYIKNLHCQYNLIGHNKQLINWLLISTLKYYYFIDRM